MSPSRFAPLRTAALASATGKLNLTVGGASILLSLGALVSDLGGQTLPIVTLGLGMAAYAAMIALDLSQPEFIRKANARGREVAASARQAVEPLTLVDPEIRAVYAAILEALDNCRKVYDAGSEGLRSSLADGMRRAEELSVVARRAATRSNSICRHLEANSPAGLEAELSKLQELRKQTSDETAQRDFAQAADAKSKELETYRQLQGLHDRIHAQLRLIETSLDGLSAKLVKLDATDLAEAISINDSLSENLRTMTSDVEILESTYEETMQELRA